MTYSYVCTYVNKCIYITSKRFLKMENWITGYYKSAQKFRTIYETPGKFRRQKGVTKQVPH